METSETSEIIKNEDTQEKYAFVLAFAATCWKRIWVSAILYCKHQKIPLSTSVILKCLKYNLLCLNGIFYEIEPYLKKALIQGFLMPKEYEKKPYVKRAVQLFGETYKISKLKDQSEKKKAELKFINNYAFDITLDKNKDNEMKDIITNIPNYKENADKHCSFCELIELWDIEIGIYEFKNIYQELIIYSLLQILSEE